MAVRDFRLDGRNPLSYLGVNPVSPPGFYLYHEAPTQKDLKGYYIGDLWLDTVNEEVWILVAKENTLLVPTGIATWIKIGDSDNFASSFLTDAGTAIPVGGELNVLGGNGLNTTGAGNNLSIRMDAGANGQVLIGGGAASALGNITSAGGTVTITNGPNSINLESNPIGLLRTLSGVTGTATPVGGIVTIAGGTNITTAAGGGAGDEVTVNLDDSIVLAGTLTLAIFGAGVLQTDATGLVASDNGANGEMLIGGGAAPAWAAIVSAGATIDITNGANSIDLTIADDGTLRILAGDTGTALADGTGTSVLAGGTNITTAAGGGAGDEVEINLDGTIALAGTLTLAALGAGVMQTDGAGLVTSDNGANGQVLIGGGAAPAWANITSTGGSVTITNGVNSIDLDVAGPPSFLAYFDTPGINASAGYTFGTGDVLGEIFDTGNNFFPGDGIGGPAIFTAPVTGKYFLNLNTAVLGGPSAFTVTEYILRIITSNRAYLNEADQNTANTRLELAKKLSTCADMDIGDTATFYMLEDRLVGAAFIVTGTAVDPRTWISGYLITT